MGLGMAVPSGHSERTGVCLFLFGYPPNLKLNQRRLQCRIPDVSSAGHQAMGLVKILNIQKGFMSTTVMANTVYIVVQVPMEVAEILNIHKVFIKNNLYNKTAGNHTILLFCF